MTEELKKCQLCHQILPKSDFYKRKDRDGEYTWTMSYCGPCDMVKVKQSKVKNPEHYKEYINKYNNDYYHQYKDRVRIVQKRYYYNKLTYEKQIKYKQKLLDKYPEMVDQICV
jgi:hypothetical protein